ncbi:MAG: metallophosphoesterase, partial [Chloroflexota bacterium]
STNTPVPPTSTNTPVPPAATNTPVPPTSTNTPVGSVVIAAVGDIACSPSSTSYNSGLGTSTECHQKATSDILGSLPLSAVITLGDNQYESGALADYQVSYQNSWGAYIGITKPAPGNHEYGTSGAAGYFDYFGAAAGTRGLGYYSYNLGNWHLISLNSNCALGGCEVGSTQYNWLVADLAVNTAPCTLAYWHHPRFSSGSHGNNLFMGDMWTKLYDANADLILSGHDHQYERFGPQDPNTNADLVRGIRQFVAGTGGKSLYNFNLIKPNSQVRDKSAYGVLKLTLHSNSYDWQFVPEAGKTFTDSGSQACH